MNLSEIRKDRGKTQLQVAKDLLIDPTTLCNYEKGKTEPNIQTLCKLADYYHVSLDELVGRETNNINLFALKPVKKKLVEYIIQMNDTQEMKAEAYLDGLMENK